MIDSIHLSRALTERFGLEVEATISQKDDGKKIIVNPSGIEPSISFKIEIHLGWRTVNAEFIPGNYAIDLVSGIKSASISQKAAFVVFAESLKSKGAIIKLEYDHEQIDASKPEDWPDDFSSISITMKKVGIVVERTTGYDFDAVFPWATGFFGLAIALLPFEEIEETILEGETEGLQKINIGYQYERSRINRAACIEVNGTDCKICGFSFRRFYGKLGEGFIHVHHIVPVSQMGGSYMLNPAEDLIPVCPNCHAMMHRREPALSPEELFQIIENK